MPAPKRPNTAAATEATKRRGQETMAAKLREAGWAALTPEDVTYLDLLPDEELRAFVRAGGRPCFGVNGYGRWERGGEG